MKDNNTEYFGPEFLASLASDNTPTGGAPDLAQTFAAREARDAVEQPSVEPPSAEAVAWLREWINDDPRDGDGEPMMLDADDAMCQEYVRDILRYVEGR